jgi:hypothetical protein
VTTEREANEKKLTLLNATILHLEGAVWSASYAGLTCNSSDVEQLKRIGDALSELRSMYRARRDALAEALS